MKRSEYEERRRALEETFESEFATLRAAHQIRLRSLEQLWLADPEEDVPLAPPAPPSSAPPRVTLAQVTQAIQEILPRLPEVFDKNDVVRLLEWDPPRGTLFRALTALVTQGRLTIAHPSMGRVSNLYRQTVVPDEP